MLLLGKVAYSAAVMLTLTIARARALATGALLTEANGDSHDWLGGDPPLPSAVNAARLVLVDHWEVVTRDDLRAVVRRLSRGRPRAWDLARATNIAGWGWLAGLVDETEAWAHVAAAARSAQNAFASWASFGAECLRNSEQDGDEMEELPACLERLLVSPESPWRRLAWGTSLDAQEDAVEPVAASIRAAFHEACPSSPAHRFALALRGPSAVAKHQSLAFLGGLPGLPRHRGAAVQSFGLEDRGPDQVRAIVRHSIDRDASEEVEGIATAARAAKGKKRIDPELLTQIGWLKREGKARLSRAVEAWSAMNAAEVANLGYVAGYLRAEQAWALLLDNARAAQRRFLSWEDFADHLAVGTCVFAATETMAPAKQCALDALRSASDSPWKSIPWSVDLRAEAEDGPLAVPATLAGDELVVTVRVTFECPSCMSKLHVQRFESHVTCARCAHRVDVDAEAWHALLGDTMYEARLHREPVRHAVFYEGASYRVQHAWELDSPRCPRCRQPLGLSPLRGPGSGERLLDCLGCGEKIRARRPEGVLARVDPEVAFVLGEAFDGELGLAPQAPVSIACLGCGAPLAVDGSERAPACASCGTQSFLSPALWARFHPPPRRRAVSFVLPAHLGAVDVPKLRPSVAAYGDMCFATAELDYQALFATRALSGPPDLPADEVASLALRWMAALGALDRHLAGQDHGRLSGVPRTVAYRARAGARLAHELEVRSPTALVRALSAPVPKLRTVDEARRRAELARLGTLVGWIDAQDVLRLMRPIARAIQRAMSSFAEYASAQGVVAWSSAKASEIRRAAAELLEDPCSPWCTLAWATELDGDACYPLDTDPIDCIRVRASIDCYECQAEIPIDDLVASVTCSACSAVNDLSRDPFRARLEQPVFVARQLPEGVADRAADFRDDGTWHIDVLRGTPRCDNCAGELPVASWIAAREQSDDVAICCPRCALPAPLRRAGPSERAIDPRARWVLGGKGAAAPPAAIEVSCSSCGAKLAADGTSRIVSCRFGRAEHWLADGDWLRFHPAPKRRGFYLVVSKNRRALGKVVALPDGDSTSRHVLFRGVPLNVYGHEAPEPIDPKLPEIPEPT